MIKKLAGAAVSTLLIAAVVAGPIGIAGAMAGKTDDPMSDLMSEITAADAPAAESVPDDYAAYLFVHFVDTEETADKEQIYFSVSENGTGWTTLNGKKPVMKSNVGEKGVRDPHIIRTPDNKFVIIATDLSIFNRGGNWGTAQTGGSRNIVIWQSDTIDGWEDNGGTLTTVGTPDALDVWAPESIWDVDKEQYMVTWASIVGDRDTNTAYDWKYRIYRSYTTDFVNFTEPEVYMERKDNIIDTTFYYNEANKMYYRFTKDEDGDKKWVFMEQGAHLDGDFEMVATYSIDGKHYSETTGVEGPTVYKDNDTDKWYLLLDNWTYKPYETTDITTGVFTKGSEFTFNGPRFRHGSVIPITQEEYDALLEKYPVDGQVPVDPTDPDKTTGSLIYDLDFENSNFTATTGEFTATPSADFTFVDGKKAGTKAAEFKDSKFLTLAGDLFKGKDNLTVSFDVKITGDGTSWLLFAAPNANQMSDPRHYYGVLFKDGGTFSAERYNNQNWSRDNDAYDNHQSSMDWTNVTIVYYKTYTKLFINGQPASGKATAEAVGKLTEIIGNDPTVYIGKANWGNGEFSNMLLDRFRVYDYAMPDAEVSATYAADQA